MFWLGPLGPGGYQRCWEQNLNLRCVLNIKMSDCVLNIKISNLNVCFTGIGGGGGDGTTSRRKELQVGSCPHMAGLRSGMPRGPAGATGLQTIHTKLPNITPRMTIFL